MTGTQLILYGLLAIVIALYVRRWLLVRSLKHYTPSEAAARMKSSESIFLDVRTSTERQHQSIRGSLHIPLQELGRRMDELKKYKHQEIICYCQSGNRSVYAASKLQRAGFSAANMKGGIAEWNSSGLK